MKNRWYGTEVTDSGFSLVEFEGRSAVAVLAEGLSADEVAERCEFANVALRGMEEER